MIDDLEASDSDEECVLLDTLSGFEFEEVVGRIIQRLGIGKVEKVLFTQDEGRDILVRSPNGSIVVECKHQPDTSIGRPIVQKLHSAVISSGSVKGMLVTTGRFTAEAIQYSKKLEEQGTIIEMVDMPILSDMASRAKVILKSKGEALSVWTYSLPNEADTRTMVGSFISENVKSYPRKPQELLGDCERKLSYRPMYAVRYSVDASFETSVGLIHRERASNAKMMFDGNSGSLTRDDVTEFFTSEQPTRFTGAHPDLKEELPTFKVDSTSLRRAAKKTIIRLHTKTVTYSGKNNVSYSRRCEPGDHDVSINDIRQLYLPKARFVFTLGGFRYSTDGVQGPSNRFLPTFHDILVCRICRNSISENAVLCDVCGRITHSGGLRLGSIHGFKCGECGRTTCRADGHWRKRYLIWHQLLCPKCNEELHRGGSPTQPLESMA